MHLPSRGRLTTGLVGLMSFAAGMAGNIGGYQSRALANFLLGIAVLCIVLLALSFLPQVRSRTVHPGRQVEPIGLEEEILGLVKKRARSLSELRKLTGAATEFLKAATDALEAKGKVMLKGSEVSLIVAPALTLTPDIQAVKIPAIPLRVSGGNGAAFETTDPILSSNISLLSRENVLRQPIVILLRVESLSDVVLKNVHVVVSKAEPTPLAGQLPKTLEWYGSGAETHDLGPGQEGHVKLARLIELGVSGLQREYERVESPVELKFGQPTIITVEAWAENAAGKDTRRFMVIRQHSGIRPFLVQELPR